MLVRFSGLTGNSVKHTKIIRSHSLKLLATIFEVDTDNLSILEFDAFGMLVDLTFSLPSLFSVSQVLPMLLLTLVIPSICTYIYCIMLTYASCSFSRLRCPPVTCKTSTFST